MAEFAFPALVVHRKTGQEAFRDGPAPLGFSLLQFWQWSASDLVSNALRGVLAEFLVAKALGVADGTRVEWDAFDLTTPRGLKIEVKSAAYVQSWGQARLSSVAFDIAPTRGWDAKTNTQAAELARQAGLYVFAFLSHRDKPTVDPLDVGQWEFFILPASVLNERVPTQQSLALSTLKKLGPTKCQFGQLRECIENYEQSAGVGPA